MEVIHRQPAPQEGYWGRLVRCLGGSIGYAATQWFNGGNSPPLSLGRHDPQAQGDAEQGDEQEHSAQRELHPTAFRVGHAYQHEARAGGQQVVERWLHLSAA